MTAKTRFHPIGFSPALAELGSGTGAFAQMGTTTLDHLTLLYVLHCPILS